MLTASVGMLERAQWRDGRLWWGTVCDSQSFSVCRMRSCVCECMHVQQWRQQNIQTQTSIHKHMSDYEAKRMLCNFCLFDSVTPECALFSSLPLSFVSLCDSEVQQQYLCVLRSTRMQYLGRIAPIEMKCQTRHRWNIRLRSTTGLRVCDSKTKRLRANDDNNHDNKQVHDNNIEECRRKTDIQHINLFFVVPCSVCSCNQFGLMRKKYSNFNSAEDLKFILPFSVLAFSLPQFVVAIVSLCSHCVLQSGGIQWTKCSRQLLQTHNNRK